MVRVCDGCFNWGLHQLLAMQAGAIVGATVGAGSGSHGIQQQQQEIQNAKREDADQQELYSSSNSNSCNNKKDGKLNRKGGLLGFFRKDGSYSSSAPVAARRATESIGNAMGELKAGLQDRGERLESLADKTTELAECSAQFADMAKQLNEQYGSGRGWW